MLRSLHAALRSTSVWLTLNLLLVAGCGESRRPPQKAGAGNQPSTTTPSIKETAHSPVPAVAEEESPTTVEPKASDVASSTTPATQPEETEEAPPKPLPPPPEVEGLQRLVPKYDVWLDMKNKRVVLVGQICRREGQLEMFACLKNSKEHESIVAVNTQAFIVNAGLIAVGANPGHPVQFRPEFKAAEGPEVEVTVVWTDEKGKRQQTRAQEWIRHVKTGKPMEHNWIFGGSGFWVDENTGERHFMAEDGDLICVSNFTTAMLDLPVESSQASSDLEFEAFTERIPPTKSQVVVYLTPKLPKSAPKPETQKPADQKPVEDKKPAEAAKPAEKPPAT